MSERSKSFVLCISFCLVLAGVAAYDLKQAFVQQEKEARLQIENTSFLIGEWMKGAFVAADYILRDIVSTVPVSALEFPATDPAAHAEITRYIDAKRKTFPNAIGVGLNNGHCIVTHTLARVGYDASDREWCRVPMTTPGMQTYVSNMFISNNGQPMVIQARRFPGEGFTGLAGIGVSLDFFSNWIDGISTSAAGIVAIVDRNMTLLARKPAVPSALGKVVVDPVVKAFLASDETIRSQRLTSSVDGVPRLYSIRKIENLPFAVVVGLADKEWQADWIQRLWLTATGLVIVWLLAAFALRSYWAQLDNFEQLTVARDELEHLSITDALTGLANRRRFEDVLAAEYLRLRRDKAYLSIVMVDIDFFKPYNDNYGHVEGDRCLAAVGHAIQKAVRRPQDLAARYGGEEFCCILPDTGQAAAGVVAENIRKAIVALNLPHEHSAVADHVTASLGVATVVCDGTILPQQVVTMADERLYQAKNSGRNRVC